jgi:hypothetical protein
VLNLEIPRWAQDRYLFLLVIFAIVAPAAIAWMLVLPDQRGAVDVRFDFAGSIVGRLRSTLGTDRLILSPTSLHWQAFRHVSDPSQWTISQKHQRQASDLLRFHANNRAPARGSISIQSGWPFRCMKGYMVYNYFAIDTKAASYRKQLLPAVVADRGVMVLDRANYPTGTVTWRAVLVPYIPTWGYLGNIVIFACPALARILYIIVRKAKRVHSARCIRCGYDLTGVHEATDRCPECGRLYHES